MNALLSDGTTPWLLLAGVFTGLALALCVELIRRRTAHRATRALLHPLPLAGERVALFLRGLFVPGNEYFSRAPEDPRHPAGGLTVHKWLRIPEVHSAADVQAATTLVRLLSATCPGLVPELQSGEAARSAWGEHGIIVGPHHLAYQILDGCTPRLASVRPPVSFRLLGSGTAFDAREDLDFGLIYKGERSGTRRSFLLVMGLGDAGTVAAAEFLSRHSDLLGRLVGRRPFAAVIAVNPMRGPASATLQAIEPRPAWWRRLLYRKEWQALRAAAAAVPTAPKRRTTGSQPAVSVPTPPERRAAVAPVGVEGGRED